MVSLRSCCTNPMFCSFFTRCTIPRACHAKGHLNIQTWSEHVVSLTSLTFDLETCFAPQCRTLFEHVIFQNCSDACVFCMFLVGHLLCATMACPFSSSQLSKIGPNMVCFVHVDLEMCFYRNLFISTSKKWSETRSFLRF